jgi:hypothetical protein
MATTTPNYGWPVPTSTDYVKDGATAIEALGDAIDATVFGLPTGALTLISTTTIGSAVASVTVSSVFSATYDSYQVLYTGGVGSAAGANLYLKLNNSASTTYSSAGTLGNSSAGTLANSIQNAVSTGWNVAVVNTNLVSFNAVINRPFATDYTSYALQSNAGIYAFALNGFDNNAVSHTGFTILPSSGTLTGGTIYVYGYQK